MEPEVFLEWVEVAVGVKERVPAFNAERGDQAIDGGADGEAAVAEESIVAGASQNNRRSGHWNEGELSKPSLHSARRQFR